jgi:hypothetical protein
VAQATRQHYLGGHNSYTTGNYDVTIPVYNFDNQVASKSRMHVVNNVVSFTIGNSYVYDHLGRKTQTKQQIGSSGDNVAINQLDYSETGQLKTKRLHSVNNGPFLQKVDYTYNERGWLKTSSAPLFAMQLNYSDADDGAAPQFNGNIGNQYWGTPGMEIPLKLTTRFRFKVTRVFRTKVTT